MEEGEYNSDYAFGAKLVDMESRQKLLKERLVLVGENLVETKEELHSEMINLKKDVQQIKEDVIRMKSMIERLFEDRMNYARKSELEILEKQAQIFKPLELATKEYVDNLMKSH